MNLAKKGRRNRRNRPIKPDEQYANGKISISRFGRYVVWKSDLDESDIQSIQTANSGRFQDVVNEINSLVTSIRELVSRNPPDELLLRAWTEFAAKSLGLQTEAEIGFDEAIAYRMIDYVQSIIASTPALENSNNNVNEEDWSKLLQQVARLFQMMSADYPMCELAMRMENGEQVDLGFEDFRFKATIFWCSVRGLRFYNHQIVALRELIEPQSKIIEMVLGLTADQIVEEFSKIWHCHIFGYGEAVEEMAQIQEEAVAAAAQIAQNASGDAPNFEEIMKDVMSEPKRQARASLAANKMIRFGLFDLQETTSLPESFLDTFSWGQGQEKDFWSGDFPGWPLKEWPTFKRPFIKLRGRYYCFDLHSLFDNFYRQLERVIFCHNEQVKREWIAKRKQITEALPIDYLKRILPDIKDHGEVYYKWNTGKGGKLNWCEADRLLTIDDTMIVVEVKSGSFTWTSPATDFTAYVRSIEALVSAPSKQGDRFIDYLESSEEVDLFDASHTKTGSVKIGDFRSVVKLAVTLDPITEIAAQVQHLKKLDIEIGERPVWPVSIDDLRAFGDIFRTGPEFLHFVEMRLKAFSSDLVQLDDELDHVGLYLAHNDYPMKAQEMIAGGQALLQFFGYRSTIDEYYATQLSNQDSEVNLRQDMPTRLIELIEHLDAEKSPRRFRLTSDLLNVSGDWRETAFDQIDRQLKRISKKIPPQPLSSTGDVRVSLFIWQERNHPREPTLAKALTKTHLVLAEELTRLCLELTYKIDGSLSEIHFEWYSANDLKDTELADLRIKAEELRVSRVNAARLRGKISRNAPCPCGAPKKYKKCCGAD